MAAFKAHALVAGIAAYDTLPGLPVSVVNDACAIKKVTLE
jgi:hypothetical protein